MRQHRTKTYKEGFQTITYCEICGKEGLELQLSPACTAECVETHLTKKKDETK